MTRSGLRGITQSWNAAPLAIAMAADLLEASVATAQDAAIGEASDPMPWIILIVGLVAAALVARIVWKTMGARHGKPAEYEPILVFAPPPPGHDPSVPPQPLPLVPKPADYVESSTIRFYRPPEGTVQFLPGRLEIAEGEDRGHQIRFIRAWGEDQEVTFGRSEGPPHRHIQLRAPTVSRNHARMRFDGSQWAIENLSSTNPIMVNGEAANGEQRILREGDRVSMGEIVFTFRER